MGYEVRDKVFRIAKRELLRDTTDYRTINRIWELLESKRLSRRERAMAVNMARTMAPQRTSEVDRKVEALYDKVWNACMQRAIDRKELDPPDKEDVAFMRRMQKKMHPRK